MSQSRPMKLLHQGQQSLERFSLLLSLTRIDSDDVIDALRDHLVRGVNDTTAAAINGVEKSNLSRAIKRLEQAAATVEAIKELDYCHVSNKVIVYYGDPASPSGK